MSIDEEVLRLRERVHVLINDVLGLQFQVEDLREWRAETRHLLEQCRTDLDDMIEARKVTDALSQRAASAWTRREKLLALAVAVLAVLSPHIGSVLP